QPLDGLLVLDMFAAQLREPPFEPVLLRAQLEPQLPQPAELRVERVDVAAQLGDARHHPALFLAHAREPHLEIAAPPLLRALLVLAARAVALRPRDLGARLVELALRFGDRRAGHELRLLEPRQLGRLLLAGRLEPRAAGGRAGAARRRSPRPA